MTNVLVMTTHVTGCKNIAMANFKPLRHSGTVDLHLELLHSQIFLSS